jgi:hypothetical protein
MIARINLSHPKQSSIKLKIVPSYEDTSYVLPKSAIEDNILKSVLETDDESTDEIIRQRLAERELIRQKLLAAGFLVTEIELSKPLEGWEDEDTDDLLPIQLPPNSKTTAEWLDEERGDY